LEFIPRDFLPPFSDLSTVKGNSIYRARCYKMSFLNFCLINLVFFIAFFILFNFVIKIIITIRCYIYFIFIFPMKFLLILGILFSFEIPYLTSRRRRFFNFFRRAHCSSIANCIARLYESLSRQTSVIPLYASDIPDFLTFKFNLTSVCLSFNFPF